MKDSLQRENYDYAADAYDRQCPFRPSADEAPDGSILWNVLGTFFAGDTLPATVVILRCLDQKDAQDTAAAVNEIFLRCDWSEA